MNILSNAIKEYANGNYAYALSLFQKAGDIFGEHIVRYHIEKCEYEIKKNPSLNKAISSETPKSSILPKGELDLATKILLSNVAKLDLTDKKEQLIAEWKQLTSKKSLDAEIKKVNPIPADFPKDLTLAPLPDGVNDFSWSKIRNKVNNIQFTSRKIGLSVIVTTFNRSNILGITLACLVNQKTKFPYEVIVADDGSSEELIHVIREYEKYLDIRYVRQKDNGFQASATRNMGLKLAKYDFIGLLDCDMAPNPLWVESYLNELIKDNNLTLIGPRKYIDTHGLLPREFLENPLLLESLPEVRTNNSVAGKIDGEISIDWRLEHFKKTDNLRLSDSPFRFFAAGNVAFAKKWLNVIGYFDEEFNHWGGEDVEFGYRLFRYGSFFKTIDNVMAYHQEPPGKENETDRAAGKEITLGMMREKVPYIYRKPLSVEESHINRVPLVSIYIPAYNCASYIQRCVDSALNQTIVDLEVCICNDGSTDNTLEVINNLYGNNPRVKIISKENGGIASASNAAVKACSGYYIGQLDSDDYLEPDAVELCLTEFLKDKNLACVYTTNRNVKPDGSLIANGYNWSEFSREKLTTAMIAHHFRMFTIRAWYLTDGFNEKIENAVDYDMFLKLSEVGKFKHLNKICYNRVLHGDNTSIKKLGIQKNNHFIVVNQSLQRQGIKNYSYSAADNDDNSRKYIFDKKEEIINQNNSRGQMISYLLVYPDKLDSMYNKILNTLEYNPTAHSFIIHVDKKHITGKILNQVKEISSTKNVEIILNTDIPTQKNTYGNIEYYLSNFRKISSLNNKPDYVVWDTQDSLFVLSNSINHMLTYDLGANFSPLSGEWKDKILSHRSFVEFLDENLKNQNLGDWKIKGSPNGIFLKYNIAEQVFNKLELLLSFCKKRKDMPSYRADDFWVQFSILLVEKLCDSEFKKTSALTYMPWERKLQWTKEQIEEAKQGMGIPKGKFLINKIDI